MSSSFSMYSGDSRTLLIAITDAAGSPVDVSEALGITYGIFKLDGTNVLEKTLEAGVTVAAHVVTVTLAPADTADLEGRTYIHELEIVTATGEVSTVLQDHITVIEDYIT